MNQELIYRDDPFERLVVNDERRLRPVVDIELGVRVADAIRAERLWPHHYITLRAYYALYGVPYGD